MKTRHTATRRFFPVSLSDIASYKDFEQAWIRPGNPELTHESELIILQAVGAVCQPPVKTLSPACVKDKLNPPTRISLWELNGCTLHIPRGFLIATTRPPHPPRLAGWRQHRKALLRSRCCSPSRFHSKIIRAEEKKTADTRRVQRIRRQRPSAIGWIPEENILGAGFAPKRLELQGRGRAGSGEAGAKRNHGDVPRSLISADGVTGVGYEGCPARQEADWFIKFAPKHGYRNTSTQGSPRASLP